MSQLDLHHMIPSKTSSFRNGLHLAELLVKEVHRPQHYRPLPLGYTTITTAIGYTPQ